MCVRVCGVCCVHVFFIKLRVYLYAYVYAYVYVRVCMYICVCSMCMYAYMYDYVYVVCVCVCVCVEKLCVLIITSARRLCFCRIHLFVCLFVCQQDCTKNYKRIRMGLLAFNQGPIDW